MALRKLAYKLQLWPRPLCCVGGRGMNVCGHWCNVMMLTAENEVLGQRNSLVLNFSTTNLMQDSLLLKKGLCGERPATVQVAARPGIAIIRSVDKQFTTINLYLLETYLTL